MYKFVKVFSVIATFLTLLSMANPSEAAKKNVAIMTIDNNSDTVQTGSESIVYKLVAENMANQLIVAFHGSDDYAVIDREKVSKALSGAGIKTGEAVGQDQAIKIGKTLNAQCSVIGKIVSAEVVENKDRKALEAIKNSKGQDYNDVEDSDNSEEEITEVNKATSSVPSGDFEGKITVDLKFLDNETGEVIFSDEINSSKSGTSGASALRAACKAAAEDFIAQVAKQAPIQTEAKAEEQSPTEENPSLNVSDISVIYVEGDVLYIDKGNDGGIKVGDILLISKKAVPITDMEGKIITVRTTEVGKALVTEVNKNHSICKIIERKDSESDSIKRGCTAQKTDD